MTTRLLVYGGKFALLFILLFSVLCEGFLFSSHTLAAVYPSPYSDTVPAYSSTTVPLSFTIDGTEFSKRTETQKDVYTYSFDAKVGSTVTITAQTPPNPNLDYWGKVHVNASLMVYDSGKIYANVQGTEALTAKCSFVVQRDMALEINWAMNAPGPGAGVSAAILITAQAGPQGTSPPAPSGGTSTSAVPSASPSKIASPTTNSSASPSPTTPEIPAGATIVDFYYEEDGAKLPILNGELITLNNNLYRYTFHAGDQFCTNDYIIVIDTGSRIVCLDRDTNITVVDPNGMDTLLQLGIGRIYVSSADYAPEGQLTIKTPHCSITDFTTQFDVEVTDASTTVRTYRGIVSVSDPSKTNTVYVSNNEVVTATAGNMPSAASSFDANTVNRWWESAVPSPTEQTSPELDPTSQATGGQPSIASLLNNRILLLAVIVAIVVVVVSIVALRLRKKASTSSTQQRQMLTANRQRQAALLYMAKANEP